MERPWSAGRPSVRSPPRRSGAARGLEATAGATPGWLFADLTARSSPARWPDSAGVVFRHPGFLSRCHGIQPPGGIFLFTGVDLARGADGRWRVVNRTQAPTGAGYALENRDHLAPVAGVFASARPARWPRSSTRCAELPPMRRATTFAACGPAHAWPVQRPATSSMRISRVISAIRWSRAAISRCATAFSSRRSQDCNGWM